MKEAVSMKVPVYKDQGGGSGNIGKLIEVGDTVRFIIRNDAGAQTTQDVTVTAVLEQGKTIQWDNSTTGNLRTEDIVRVHQRHQYSCPGPSIWTATLTEATFTAIPMSVTSITFSGATYPVNISETAAEAGIQQTFVDALINKINSILGDQGIAKGVITGSAGTQTLTITISDLLLRWDAIARVGAGGAGPTESTP